jgi:hypothetical protein
VEFNASVAHNFAGFFLPVRDEIFVNNLENAPEYK